MEAGEQDQLIFFERPVETNVGGELTTVWTDVSGDSPPSPDYAKVISQKGSEAFESARTNATALVRVRVRYRSDVLSTWRFSWEGQYYNITHVDASQRRDGVLWLTGEIVGAA